MHILPNKSVFIDVVDEGTIDSDCAGFICRGAFHRFAGVPRKNDGAEQLWAWMHERLVRHHGIRKKHVGLYLKELEWKYNNRLLSAQDQALKIVALMPADFLHPVRHARSIHLDLVRKRA